MVTAKNEYVTISHRSEKTIPEAGISQSTSPERVHWPRPSPNSAPGEAREALFKGNCILRQGLLLGREPHSLHLDFVIVVSSTGHCNLPWPHYTQTIKGIKTKIVTLLCHLQISEQLSTCQVYPAFTHNHPKNVFLMRSLTGICIFPYQWNASLGWRWTSPHYGIFYQFLLSLALILMAELTSPTLSWILCASSLTTIDGEYKTHWTLLYLPKK